jgi:hypothetical protein
MKVLYSTARKEGDDPSFTLGASYLVLGVRFQTGVAPVIVVSRDSDGIPVLAELRYFDVEDPSIPGDWCFFDFGDGFYALEPKEFTSDFWSRFHDGDSVAEKTLQQVVEKIRAFHA